MVSKRILNIYKLFVLIWAIQFVAIGPSHASRQCLKYLVDNKSGINITGNISISRTESRSEEASFTGFVDKFYIKPDLSQKLLSQLSLLNERGPRDNLTEFRVEEKAIITNKNATTFLNETSKDLSLTWQLRDVPPPGKQFLTVTAYGKTFQFANEGLQPIVGKLRIRKYYSHDPNGQNLQSVFPNISALELKLSNIGRFDNTGKAIVVENGVFKPRIYISDSQLVQLLQLARGKFESAEALQKLISDIAELKNPATQQNFNKPEHVKYMLETLELLQSQAPKLLETDKVIAYNRKSYSALDKEGNEYQFTLDEKVRVFAGNPKILCCNLEKYLSEKPLEILPKDYVFAELKSPISEKLQYSKIYTALYSTLIREHFGTLNQGKYSLSAKKISTIFEENSNSIIEERGTLLWLIRGASFFPEPQNRKGIVEHGQVKIAIPFEYQTETYRMMVEYKTVVTTNAKREAYADKIQIIDQAGRKIDLKDSDLKDVLRSFRDFSDKELAGLMIEGVPIIIKPKITADELKAYIDFFNDFFVNFSKSPKNPRDPELLQRIHTSKQLSWYIKKMKLQNFLAYTWSRIHRITMGADIGAAVIWYSPFAVEKVTPPPQQQSIVEQYIIEVKEANGVIRYYDTQKQEFVENGSWPSHFQAVPLSEVLLD